jgi:hypothetical protein
MKAKSWIWTAAIASLMIFASSFFWLPANQSVLNAGDPARVEHRSVDGSAPIWVKSVLPECRGGWPCAPAGTTIWKKFDLDRDGVSMQEFIRSMYRETFGQSGDREIGRSGEQTRQPGHSPDHPIARSPDLLAENISPRLPNLVHVVGRHPDGTVFYDHLWHNLRTNAGINWQYGQMAGSTAAVCTYIALTNTAITPNATDTSLSGEITTNGLARALGTASHTSNATSYTVANTFTATAAQGAQATGLFNASSAGTMCFENTFSAVTLNQNDTLTVTWTVTF